MLESNISLLLSHISTNNSTQHIIVCCLSFVSKHPPHQSPPHLYREETLVWSVFQWSCLLLSFAINQIKAGVILAPASAQQSLPVYNYNPTNCYQACLLLKPFFVYLSYLSFLMPRLAAAWWGQRLPPASYAWPAICLPSPSQITVFSIGIILGSIKQSRNQSNWDRSSA